MFYTTSCRGHKITVICGFAIVSHVQEFFQQKFIMCPELNVLQSYNMLFFFFLNAKAMRNSQQSKQS